MIILRSSTLRSAIFTDYRTLRFSLLTKHCCTDIFRAVFFSTIFLTNFNSTPYAYIRFAIFAFFQSHIVIERNTKPLITTEAAHPFTIPIVLGTTKMYTDQKCAMYHDCRSLESGNISRLKFQFSQLRCKNVIKNVSMKECPF